MNVIKWVLQAISVPSILILVWIFDFRPFSFIFTKLDEILVVNLAANIAQKDIPPAIFGAIDVALLTFFYNLFIIILSNFFIKPAKVVLEINDYKSNANFVSIPFDENQIGSQAPKHIILKGEIEVIYGKWILDYFIRGLRITLNWHPEWISIEPQIKGIEFYQKSGELNFNFLDMLSDSDTSTSINGKLSIMVNSNFKRSGKVSIKVGSNSKCGIIRFCVSLFIPLLVNCNLKSCEIMLQKGS